MQKASIKEIIRKIQSEETFEVVSDDYSFTLKIDTYVPFVCGAIHDGHQFRKSLWENCLHTEYERWFEEDPATKQMIHSFPIVIAGCDSRFEYDLNRAPEKAIYTDAWGKQLWRKPLSEEEKKHSLQKHNNFYKVVKALISKIEEKFSVAVVYDMHSYNWKRWSREVPVFNIGAGKVDTKRFGKSVELWREMLSEIKLPDGTKSTSRINDTFQGNGYFLEFITSNFKNTLVLATEVKKVYCDEHTQIMYKEVIYTIEKQLKVLLFDHATNFYNTYRKDL
ncbi:MAG: N-formylglutamate amidohydrolase [Flavobacteriaceae bacterium]|nr:N-formylglutamate amidohydrolase [Flavobacteriaceae bacterium]